MPIYQFSSTSTVTVESDRSSTAVNQDETLTASTATLIAPENVDRKQISIFLGANETVYFDYFNTVSASSYAFKLTEGGFYELPSPIYTGDIYAFCANSVALKIRELE